MNNAKENKEAIITFRVRDELKKKLEELAVRDNRTLSNFLVNELERLVWIKRKHYFDPSLNQRYLKNHLS